ncbi:MAG: GNAT family N-acetyltransferase [Fimbriimonadaceae bacterium]|nr:GNAT family N-acetyltransferase [Fimbriimonadaceae bacterium]
MTTTDFTIRPWCDDDSVERLTDLLHSAYAEWGQADIYFTAVGQDASVTRERLEGGTTWLAVDGEAWIGTVTVYPGAGNSIAYYNDRPGLWYFGQFGVDPAWKGRGVGRALFETAMAHAVSQGAREFACDTNREAARLIALYERWGLTQVGQHTWPGGGLSVVLAMPLPCGKSGGRQTERGPG